MEKNEFEDLGIDIWIRLLQKNEEFPDQYLGTDSTDSYGKKPK